MRIPSIIVNLCKDFSGNDLLLKLIDEGFTQMLTVLIFHVCLYYTKNTSTRIITHYLNTMLSITIRHILISKSIVSESSFSDMTSLAESCNP